MGLNRYYVPQLRDAAEVSLQDEEMHHAIKVRREVVGATCILFDGKGYESLATFNEINKRNAILSAQEPRYRPKVLAGNITAVVAIPKGDRAKAVIERLVELGIHRLAPVICDRSIRQPNDDNIEKWERWVIEACKQCERNQVLEILKPTRFTQWLEEHNLRDNNDIQSSTDLDSNLSAYWLSHPSVGTDSIKTLRSGRDDIVSSERVRPSSIQFAVGPEGGFTESEFESAKSCGWIHYSLGPRILRVETAVAALSQIAAMMVGELDNG